MEQIRCHKCGKISYTSSPEYTLCPCEGEENHLLKLVLLNYLKLRRA